MKRLPLDEIQENLDDALLLVSNAKQRIVIQDEDEDRAALVPLEDLELLENLDGDANVEVEHLSLDEVKKHFAEDLSQVSDREERIVLRKDDVDVVALVPGRDLATLENLDARIDIEAAKRLLENEIQKDSP